MNFQEKNKIFVETKKLLREARTELDVLRVQMGVLATRKSQSEADKENAITNGDKAAERMAIQELKKIEEEYNAIENKLIEKRESVVAFEQSIDDIIKEVGQDPAIRRSIDNNLNKKYDKTINKYEKEMEKLKDEEAKDMKEKNLLIVLTKVIDENPETAKKLTEFVNNKKKFNDLNDEAQKLNVNDPKDQQRLEQIFVELQGIKEPIETGKKEIFYEVAQNIKPVTEIELDKVLDNIIDNGLELDKSKNIDINKTLQSNIKRVDKDIKNIDKKIKRKDDIIESYKFSKSKLEITTPSNTNPVYATHPVPADKPKWYQFGKRFAQWINNLRRGDDTPTTPENSKLTTSNHDTNIDKEDMKTDLYKIARDSRTNELNNQRQAFIKLNQVKAQKRKVEEDAVKKFAELTDKEDELSKEAGIDR